MARRAAHHRRQALLIAGWMATTALVCVHAQAQQTGLTVTAGAASLSSPKAGQTVITQTTSKAILNWQSFSIPAGNAVVFDQPGPGAIALNRVLGPSASLIDGSLTANGQVWLINPNGILFGAGSSVNVAGLIATASDIRDQDFLTGNYAFGIASGNSSATVVNQGSIKIRRGGSAVLAAPGVANSGLIEATLGTVALGSGNGFTVDFHGDKLLSFAISQPVTTAPTDASGHPVPALVSNSGTIAASGGQVLMTVAAARDVIDNVINMSGTVVATTAHEVDGAIIIDAGANGAAAVSGTLDASGRQAGEMGGTVKILGASVALLSGASVDASGDAGGGKILIGGNLHGAGPERNAQSVSVAQGVSIAADAITSGNGGTVALWSDGRTVFNGSISAQGGAEGGNGGFVETSGATLALATGLVTALAPHGAVGTWLLDPANVTIAATGSADFSGDQTFTGNAGASDTIAVSAIQSAGANVTLEATNNITVSAPITMANNGVGLSFSAGNTITVSAGDKITTRGGDITFAANCCGYASGSGSIGIGAALATNGGSQTGGAVSLTVAGGSGSIVLGAGITAGGGITISASSIVQQATIALSTAAGNGAVSLGPLTSGSNNLIIASGSGAISFGGLTTSGSLTLTTTGTVTQSQPVTASTLVLGGSGTYMLTQSGNSIATANGTVGTLALTDNVALSVLGTAGLKASGSITLLDNAAGGITFNSSSSAGSTLDATAINGSITIAHGVTLTANGAGDALVLQAGAGTAAGLATGGDFVNNSGSGALSTPNGNWLVYTGDLNSAGTSVGGLAPYAERYDTAADFAPGSGGNFIFYRAAPVLTVTAASQAMTYGGTVPTLTFTSAGEVNGDTQSSALAGSPGLATTAGSTSDVGAYAITGTFANPLNYVLSFQAGTLTVNPATLTVTPNAAAAVYNATALDGVGYSSTLGNYTITGLVNGQTLGAAGVMFSGSLAFNGSTATPVQNAGTYSLGQGSLALASAHSDYAMSFANPLANSYVIDPLAVVLAGSRSYDATAAAAAGILTVSNDLDGANLTLSGSAPLTGQNVGPHGFASGAGLTLGGSAAGNYTLAGVAANGSAVLITPASLTVAPDAGQFKLYGTNDPTLAYAASGFQGSDSASLLTGALTRNGFGTLGGEQVGTYTITSGSLSAGGNYAIALTAQTFAISPATLAIVANAQSKTYGSNDPALTYRAAGLVTNTVVDGVSLNDSLTGTLARADFGTLPGEQAGSYAIGQNSLTAGPNYSIAYTGANLTIGPATLAIVANAQSKTYGGNDPALTYSAAGLVTNTVVDGVSLNDSVSGSLARADFGTLPGEQAGSYAIAQGNLTAGPNYSIAYSGANLSINPATLAIVANAQSKTYGGNDPALTYSAAGLVTNTVVDGVSLNDSLTGGLSRVAGETVLGGPYVIAQGNLTAGPNYDIAYSGAALTINPLAVILSGSRLYDGTTGAAAGILAVSNDLDGANLTLSGSGTLTGKDVGANRFGSPASLTLGGSAAANYTLAGITTNGSAVTISPASLTLAAASDSKIYDATTASAAAPTVVGLMNGDSVANLAQAFQSKDVMGPGGSTLAVTAGYSIEDGIGGRDYSVSLLTAPGTITPATLTYVANPAAAAVGNLNLALSGSVTGFVASDSLATSTTGALAFATPATAGSAPGQYAITGSGLAALDYSFTQAAANATALTINAAANAAAQLHTFAVMASIAALPPPPPPPTVGNSQSANTTPPTNPPPPPPNSFADAGSLNDIAPTAGGAGPNSGNGSGSGPNDDNQTDNATTMMFQSVGGHTEASSGGGGKSNQANAPNGPINRSFINGMLVLGPPPATVGGGTHEGVPAGDVEFSNWGNEAFWQ